MFYSELHPRRTSKKRSLGAYNTVIAYQYLGNLLHRRTNETVKVASKMMKKSELSTTKMSSNLQYTKEPRDYLDPLPQGYIDSQTYSSSLGRDHDS